VKKENCGGGSWKSFFLDCLSTASTAQSLTTSDRQAADVNIDINVNDDGIKDVNNGDDDSLTNYFSLNPSSATSARISGSMVRENDSNF